MMHTKEDRYFFLPHRVHIDPVRPRLCASMASFTKPERRNVGLIALLSEKDLSQASRMHVRNTGKICAAWICVFEICELRADRQTYRQTPTRRLRYFAPGL